jgi:hypothetical protein
MVTSLDWTSYPILTFPQIPEAVIDLIDRPQEVPWGGGEPTCAVVPAAISNAVFEATGRRLRSVPFTPAKVKAARNHRARPRGLGYSPKADLNQNILSRHVSPMEGAQLVFS